MNKAASTSDFINKCFQDIFRLLEQTSFAKDQSIQQHIQHMSQAQLVWHDDERSHIDINSILNLTWECFRRTEALGDLGDLGEGG